MEDLLLVLELSREILGLWDAQIYTPTLCDEVPRKYLEGSLVFVYFFPSLERAPKGSYSPKARSRHLLESPFSETLLRTLLRTLFAPNLMFGQLRHLVCHSSSTFGVYNSHRQNDQQFTYGVVREGAIAEHFLQVFREMSVNFSRNFCTFLAP